MTMLHGVFAVFSRPGDAPSRGQHQLRQVAKGTWARASLLVSSALVALGAVLLPVQLLAQETTPAFAIPSSDLVFLGELSVPGGPSIRFAAREGSLVLLDTTPLDPYGRVGVVITLDRSRFEEDGPRAIRVQAYEIEPHPDGGERMALKQTAVAPYQESLEMCICKPCKPCCEQPCCEQPCCEQPSCEQPSCKECVETEKISFKIRVYDDKFQDFQDGPLVALLWEAVDRDGEHALDGLYDLLYSLYGPIASGCKICDGVLVCGTEVSCGGTGGGYTY